MSTAQRRRGKSLHLELPGGSADEKPALAALFLIKFDLKAGYTIAWKRSIDGLTLSESVEFKSLPSGLHNVEEDLIYFVHDQDHAGVSAFVNRSGLKQERNARMLAVGALVPLEQGRLGRSWKHAEMLKELARDLVVDPSRISLLESFWQEHRQAEEPTASAASISRSPSRTVSRSRARSSASGYGIPSLGLSTHHPALSLPVLVESFGPLLYPLYKAALLRQRILILHEAPVELACNFVYDISILSNIPSSISPLIPLEPLPSRLQPLFSVGLHDIDDLKKRSSPYQQSDMGWVACTTDEILRTKTDLYDLLVILPPSHTQHARQKVWPQLRTAAGVEVKATQRDLRRYRTLRLSLRRWLGRSRSASPYSVRTRILSSSSTVDASDIRAGGLAPTPSQIRNSESRPASRDALNDSGSIMDEQLTESQSWAALAYSSFMWWASAGEQRSDLEQEAELDAGMFRDFNTYADGHGSARARSTSRRRSATPQIPTPGPPMMTDGSPAAPEMAIIAYFHRLTARILGTMAPLVERSEHEADEAESIATRSNDGRSGPRRSSTGSALRGSVHLLGQAAPDATLNDANAGRDQADAVDDHAQETDRLLEPDKNIPAAYAHSVDAVTINSDDLAHMGLDTWSEGDRRFVAELCELYWGRAADVRTATVECCGVRIL